MTLPEKSLFRKETKITPEEEISLVKKLAALTTEEREVMKTIIPEEFKELIPSELARKCNYDEIERYASRNLTPLQAICSYIANGLERGYASRKGDFSFEDQVGYNIPLRYYSGSVNLR
jgi:hypothetical protein